MSIVRTAVYSSLFQIDHFQNRPQKNSKPATSLGNRPAPGAR
jgi:hypothetical protein